MAALACLRDLFGVESVGVGSDVDSFSVGVAPGNSSGEKDRLSDGEGISPQKTFLGRVSRVTVILLYVIFGGGESLVAGDITVHEVVGIARVIELAGVESIFVQGEHVVD